MIVINGERWLARLVPPSHPILMSPTGPALGCCDDYSKTIFISNAVPKYKMKKVLCHELVHAAMYSYNIDISDYEEEIVADLIATYGDEIITLSNIVYHNKFK